MSTSAADLPVDLAEAQREIVGLRQALQSRSVIDQAKGILMATHRCTADGAFDILRQLSNDTNVRLADLATAVVPRTTVALTVASQRENVKVRHLAEQLVELASNCDADADDWLERHLGPTRAAEGSTQSSGSGAT